MRSRTFFASMLAVATVAAAVAACGESGGESPPPRVDAAGVAEAGAEAAPPTDGSQGGPNGDAAVSDTPGITDGLGVKTGGGTGSCTPTEDRYVDGDYGQITARDGRVFPVPAPVSSGATCTDLHNPCNGGQNPDYASQLSTVVVDNDPDAVEVTGYLYADNDFELWVNGKYICRDALTFVPFNSHVVRFKARYPMTIAIQAVDWEQSLGVGVELKNGSPNVGDGGIVARFVDDKGRVTVTSTDWRCRPYYVAPVDDPACVTPDRDSSSCPPAACVAKDPATCHGVHWTVPADWASPTYDDSAWPKASTYAATAIGPKTAYTANAALFDGAEFVWSKNLLLDNLVLCRRTLGP
ncbi:MAG: hypothetical protein JNL38_05235 [Myxococcales bacterium]|nr:hypothetical protein [Myxococcales bacterium]